MQDVLIGDHNYQDFLRPGGYGLTPRNFAAHPVGYAACAPPFNLPLIPQSEQAGRLAARIAAKAQLSDVRMTGMFGQPIPSRDQDGIGYCWFHSGVSAMLLGRAAMNEPYADLSAFSGACMIKHFQDEGGEGIEGVEFQASKGVPTSQYWPQQSMSRSNDNPATWENAKLHRHTQWLDLDPSNMREQLITCLLLGFPVVVDYNWWGHSVCAADLVSLNPLTVKIWNSWGDDKYGVLGMGDLTGSKALPDAAVACIVTTASAA